MVSQNNQITSVSWLVSLSKYFPLVNNMNTTEPALKHFLHVCFLIKLSLTWTKYFMLMSQGWLLKGRFPLNATQVLFGNTVRHTSTHTNTCKWHESEDGDGASVWILSYKIFCMFSLWPHGELEWDRQLEMMVVRHHAAAWARRRSSYIITPLLHLQLRRVFIAVDKRAILSHLTPYQVICWASFMTFDYFRRLSKHKMRKQSYNTLFFNLLTPT